MAQDRNITLLFSGPSGTKAVSAKVDYLTGDAESYISGLFPIKGKGQTFASATSMRILANGGGAVDLAVMEIGMKGSSAALASLKKMCPAAI